jgi:hypothetical protein
LSFFHSNQTPRSIFSKTNPRLVLTSLVLIAARHQQPPSPFKRPLGLAHLASAHVAGNGNSLSENSSCASTSSSTSTSGMAGSHSLQVSSEPSGSEHGFHSGHLPTIADVRSPDVLHPKHGPCDCLTHPLHVSYFLKCTNKNIWKQVRCPIHKAYLRF